MPSAAARRAADEALAKAVDGAVEWALKKDAPARARALAELARTLAREIQNPTMAPEQKSSPPVAPMAKELRSTLDQLEGMRDKDDAAASLGAHLSTPVRNTKKPRASNARTTRRVGGGAAGKAADAVAKPRSRRRAGSS